MTYKVLLIHSEEGYSVSCPGLPGCASQDDTEAEALENITDAIQEYLSVREEMLREETQGLETFVREVSVAA